MTTNGRPELAGGDLSVEQEHRLNTYDSDQVLKLLSLQRERVLLGQFDAKLLHGETSLTLIEAQQRRNIYFRALLQNLKSLPEKYAVIYLTTIKSDSSITPPAVVEYIIDTNANIPVCAENDNSRALPWIKDHELLPQAFMVLEPEKLEALGLKVIPSRQPNIEDIPTFDLMFLVEQTDYMLNEQARTQDDLRQMEEYLTTD